MNKSFLNAIKSNLVAAANIKGVNLNEHFATDADFKQHVIAIAINYVMKQGKSTQEAYDFVMGDGSYDKMKNACWTTLQG
tara:strand:- start:679 stop:918 length:240 start_codon:yes stop_codon:yes gene_type:complete